MAANGKENTTPKTTNAVPPPPKFPWIEKKGVLAIPKYDDTFGLDSFGILSKDSTQPGYLPKRRLMRALSAIDEYRKYEAAFEAMSVVRLRDFFDEQGQMYRDASWIYKVEAHLKVAVGMDFTSMHVKDNACFVYDLDCVWLPIEQSHSMPRSPAYQSSMLLSLPCTQAVARIYSLLEVGGVAMESIKTEATFGFLGNGAYSVIDNVSEPTSREAEVIWKLFFALAKVALELDALLVLHNGIHLFAPQAPAVMYADSMRNLSRL
mmetsp:Transcript_37039/g.98096  ORF Transcript_37039/g.98096 Transcript_37039/m.98096 type:complete len:264 (-) Transcript_37039:333-1124(-)